MIKPLGRSVAAVAVTALLVLAPSGRADGPTPAARGKGAEPGSQLRVSTRIIERTLVGVSSKKPKPWPGGNCFSLSSLSPEGLRERARSGAALRPGSGCTS